MTLSFSSLKRFLMLLNVLSLLKFSFFISLIALDFYTCSDLSGMLNNLSIDMLL